MNNNYYNIDGIITDLKKELDRNECFLQAWKNVSFPTKKDGAPFANMSKNIDGAKYYAESYAMSKGEYKLRVTTFTKLSGYCDEEISAYEHVRYMKDEAMKAKTQNYQPKQTYFEQVYTYDLDDIKNAVSKRIEQIKDSIDSLNYQIANAERIYNNFKEGYTALIENLLKECSQDETSKRKTSLYYDILGAVQRNY